MGEGVARRGLITAVVVAGLSVVGGNVAARAAVAPPVVTSAPSAASATVSSGAAVASIEWGLDPTDATRVASVEVDLTAAAAPADAHVIVNRDGRVWPCTVDGTAIRCAIGDAIATYAFTGPLHVDVVVG